MKEHRVRMGDTDVQCIESEDRGDRVFILLHGAHFNSTIWAKVGTLRLLESHSLPFIAPDMPGFGRTARSRVYSDRSGLNRLMLDLCSHMGARSTVLIGASMGGGIALSFAKDNPPMIDGLFLVGSVGLDSPGMLEFLSLLERPVQLVWGSEDEIIPVTRAREIARKLPNALLTVMDGASHPAYISSPEKFNSILDGWLARSGFAGAGIMRR